MTEKLYSNNTVNNIQRIIEDVNSTGKEAGLQDNVVIVGVVKYQTIENANLLIQNGIENVAENYVQALAKRAPLFLPSKKHLIGHLQTNKVKTAIKIADMIQSVDSLHLLEKINTEAAAENKIMDVLVQINIAREETKTGIFAENLNELLDSSEGFENIKIRGFMAIMPIETKLLYYDKMYEIFLDKKSDFGHNSLRRNISIDYLSMGMSMDYKIAIKAGSNMVRIGRSFFS